MRAIKFRQWSGDRFFTWGLLDDGFGMHFKSPSSGNKFNPTNSEHEQFTGLLDKNGVEIYEGDIVSVDGSGICEVKISSYWGVVYVDSDGYERQHADCVSEQDYPTVIGNIHETPELLK